MGRFLSNTWRRIRLLALMVLAGGAAFALVYLISTQVAFRPGEHRTAAYPTLPSVEVQGVPVYLYAAIDPAMVPALSAISAQDRPDPLAVVVEGLPPIGVYLPATGDTQFKLPPPTPTPAVQPLKTPTALPTLTPAPTFGIITPGPGTAVGPDGMVGPAPLEYAGEGCAPSGWPVSGVLTQYFHRWHSGIDLGIPLGTAVVASMSGTVIEAGWRTDGYGNLIIIQNGAYITYYAHLSGFNVSKDQLVGRGSVIGWSGSTGNSSGPHVHYETRITDVPVDPLTFEKRGLMSC
jgi:hypothetical protein